jgi:hypothetical protein
MYLKQTLFLGYSVAAVMYLQFVLHVMLFYMLNTFVLYISTSQVRVRCPVARVLSE